MLNFKTNRNLCPTPTARKGMGESPVDNLKIQNFCGLGGIHNQ
jgi:hypothetical protein